MARVNTGRRLSYRAQERRFAASAKFPLWITIPSVLLFGLILWLGVFSDPLGHLGTPGGLILYVAAVIGVAVLLAYIDRNTDSSGKNRNRRQGYRARRNATAK
jgi:hypothetical protein